MKRAILALLLSVAVVAGFFVAWLVVISLLALFSYSAHAQQWPTPLLIPRTEPYVIATTGFCAPNPTDGRVPYGCVLSPADYSFALVWIGEPAPFPDTRVYVYTSSFQSFTSTAGFPWDIAGDYDQKYWLAYLQPYVDSSGRVSPGWYVVPIAKRKYRRQNPDGSGEQWVNDEHMRAIIYLSPPGCGLPACGAITVMARTDLSTLAQVGGVVRRRAVN